MSTMDRLKCPLCLFLMCEPVTVSCGHTFCRRCVGVHLPSKDVKLMKNNVLLFGVVEKCCPDKTRVKCHIQEKLKSQDFAEALRIVNDGLKSVSDDQSLTLYRVEANCGLMRFTDALADLSYLCGLRPDWTEVFFRKGNVLQEMGQTKEALIQFRDCLRLQAEFAPATSQIKKILESEGVETAEDVSSILQLVSKYLKEPPPLRSVSGSQGPEGLIHPGGDAKESNGRRDTHQGSKVKQDTGCLSLCQAVSFPAAEEKRTRKEEEPLSVLTVSDFECPLCIRLFYEPVTTPCGHTFCKNCIERSLDHNLRCPLCKQPLQEFFRARKYNPTVVLQQIVMDCFSQKLAERKLIHETEIAELSNLTKDIPIFVCTVAYPGVPCPLHIFEPRYRLMMRRCMDIGTKKFGMCSYELGKGFADYGCILEILSLERLPDGRSYVNTVGGSRFRVLKRGQRDGYHTADIEYLEDLKVDDGELEDLQQLHDSVYQQAREWYQRLIGRIRDQIDKQHGSMPDKEENIQALSNGPAWCWWLLSVLQLDPAYKTTVLSLTSLKDRLGHLRLVLEYFSQS